MAEAEREGEDDTRIELENMEYVPPQKFSLVYVEHVYEQVQMVEYETELHEQIFLDVEGRSRSQDMYSIDFIVGSQIALEVMEVKEESGHTSKSHLDVSIGALLILVQLIILACKLTLKRKEKNIPTQFASCHAHTI